MKNILWRLSILVLACLLLTATARANVYATDIKFNGSRAVLTTNAAADLEISYILNEPATLGTAINVTSGTNLIRTISVASGADGTLQGSNVVRWDGNDSKGNPVALGNYLVAITASASGHTNWAQISRDTNAANYVFDPRGVAVDNNSNSLYYGRVFIGSAGIGLHYTNTPGDNDTILKLNADGTFADDGPDGNGGFAGIYDEGGSDVPQKLRVADDDRLYMMDLTSYGEIVAFDMALTTNQVVFGANNYAANPIGNVLQSGGYGWFSMDVTAASTTNGLVWLGEVDAGGVGVWNWHLINGVADTNDPTGNWAIEVGGSLGVAASGGLMVDTNFDIFLGQYLIDAGDTNSACMDFTNWNAGKAFGGSPVTSSTLWSVGGANSNFLGVYDTTIDSRQSPKYVACALNGGPVTNGNGIRILNAANGATVVTNLDATNQYYATAWDNVGNLYAVTASAHLLRVFSPPSGTNQSTTVAQIQVVQGPPAPPAPISITFNHANVTVTFGVSSTNTYTPTNFALASAPVISGPFQTVTNALSAEISSILFSFTAPTNGPMQFYEILRTSAQ
jgi:hypothetical protein